MIPPRWPFPTLHAGSSWRCEFPNSKQAELQFVCLLTGGTSLLQGDVTKGQAGPSPHLSTHAPGATGAGTTARGNIAAHRGPSLKEQSLFVLRVWQKR